MAKGKNKHLGGCNVGKLRSIAHEKRVKMADDVGKDLRVHWMPRAKGSGRDGTVNEV